MEQSFPILLIDIETTGLCWEEHTKILEIGIAQVSRSFKLLMPEIHVIHHPERVLMESDPWIVEHHGYNGLIDDCINMGVRQSLVEQRCIQYLVSHGFMPGTVLVAGNSVWTDRVHLRRHMPALETCFGHRNLDFSVFKETAKMFGITENENSDVIDNHRARSGLDAALDRFEYYYHVFIQHATKQQDISS